MRLHSLIYRFGVAIGFGIGFATSVTVPAPISVEPSQHWEGNDGLWSTFPIRVGTPAQDVRVFISTLSTSTWVVELAGCVNITDPPANCSDIRGSLYDFNTSSTWVKHGGYFFQIEDTLEAKYQVDEGEFGFETVALGFAGSGGPSLNDTVLAWMITTDFFIGELGLNPRPTNFTFTDSHTSYLSLLYEGGEIPSLSFSYTAGAPYRFNKVLGSLTLGGYDEALAEPNGMSFDFYFDQSKDLTVGLQAITATNVSKTSLLPKGILTFIDSTVPQIWLPLEACQAFEAAFGLVYDATTDLYLVNETLHDSLVATNSSITFTLGATASGGATTNITFPYGAFDLEVSYPLVNTTTRYFPLRRAANDTQYTLGRTFLQEAYLTIDYGRGNFTVSQRAWIESPDNHIVSIFPPPNNTSNGTTSTGSGSSGGSGTGSSSTSSGKVATGTIAGIAIGVVVALGAAFFAGWWAFRIKKRKEDEKKSAELAAQIAEHANEPKENLTPDPYATPGGLTELEEPGQYKYHPVPEELHGEHFFTGAEVDGTAGSERRFELGGPEGIEGRFELDAPHGSQELSGAIPTEISPPPPFDAHGSEIGTVDVPVRSRSEAQAEKGDRPVRPFSWQRD